MDERLVVSIDSAQLSQELMESRCMGEQSIAEHGDPLAHVLPSVLLDPTEFGASVTILDRARSLPGRRQEPGEVLEPRLAVVLTKSFGKEVTRGFQPRFLQESPDPGHVGLGFLAMRDLSCSGHVDVLSRVAVSGYQRSLFAGS
jgi:hypothetical protein